MQFYHPFGSILGQSSKVKLLRFLSQYPGEFTGRELARLNNLSHPIVHKTLESLGQQSVVLMKKSGQAFLYSLNKNNFLVKQCLLPLFKVESRLKEIMAQILTKQLDFPIESIVLFGSVSQKQEKPTSDIDILVIVPDEITTNYAEDKILSAGMEITQSFGNQLSPIIINLTKFTKKILKKDKLLSQIFKQGQTIYGKSLNALLIYAQSQNSDKKSK